MQHKEKCENCQNYAQLLLEQKQTADMLRAVLDAGDLAVSISSLETGEILMANNKFSQLTGLPMDEIVGKSSLEVAGDCFNQQKSALFCPLSHMVLNDDGTPKPPMVWESYAVASGRHIRSKSQAVRWPDSGYVHLNTMLDITTEYEMRAELEQLAFYSSVTGLPNCKRLVMDLAALHPESWQGMYLVCFDIESLKQVNHAFGRAAGDALLTAVVTWLQGCHFPGTILYRRDDGFVLRFAGATEQRARDVAEAVAERFKQSWQLQLESQPIVVNCGVSAAVIPGDIVRDHAADAPTLVELVERAIEISRAAKQLVVYSRKLNLEQEKYNRFELHLLHCVNNGMQGFDVHYQPIVDSASGKWKQLEALCRWNSARVGPVPPNVFIAKAEKMGVIGTIGEWVLARSIKDCIGLSLHKRPGFRLSVNVSPVQFSRPDFCRAVHRLLRELRFPPGCLTLELTEGTEFALTTQVLQDLESLRSLGVHFALDDFGTGYSSFKNLKALPLAVLKTEREFTEGIEENPNAQTFFRTMAELAHNAGMKLVAEGVENVEQERILISSGADYMQGYLYSKPLSYHALQDLLGNFHTSVVAAQ